MNLEYYAHFRTSDSPACDVPHREVHLNAVEWIVEWHPSSDGPFCQVQRDPAHCRAGLYFDVVDIGKEEVQNPEEKWLSRIDVEIQCAVISWLERDRC